MQISDRIYDWATVAGKSRKPTGSDLSSWAFTKRETFSKLELTACVWRFGSFKAFNAKIRKIRRNLGLTRSDRTRML
jgi:hypothetical protein